MELKEERILDAAIKEFSAAVKVFTQKDYQSAGEAFAAMVEKYKDSDYYSVMEIQARAQVYKNICDAQIDPIKIELNSDADYLSEAVFQLNSGKYSRAVELLHHIEGKGFQDAYVNYLLGVAHYKKHDDLSKALGYMDKAVKADRHYKIVIYNDPDLARLHDDDAFNRLFILS